MDKRLVLAVAFLVITALMVVSITTATNGRQDTAVNDLQQSGGDPRTADDKNADKDKNKPRRPIQMTVATRGTNDEPKERYQVGDKIIIAVTMLNKGTTDLEVGIGNSYFQDRPRLKKDGKPVRYRPELPKLLWEKDQRPGIMGSTIHYKLEPNKPVIVHRFLLEDWYEQLEPGSYELSYKHRFWGREVAAESNTVTFEVAP